MFFYSEIQVALYSGRADVMTTKVSIFRVIYKLFLQKIMKLLWNFLKFSSVAEDKESVLTLECHVRSKLTPNHF